MDTIATLATPAEGNTNIPPPEREKGKARGWCITVHNYTDKQFEDIKNHCIEKKYEYCLGKELGKEGNTPHIQGYFYHKAPMNPWVWLKKINKEMHIEKAKFSKEYNYTYCSKEGNFVSNIQIKKSPDEFIKETEQQILNDEYKNVVWKPWQQEILNIIETKPDNRTIHWYYETKGNTGKSFLTKYIALKYNVIIADGKKADIFNQVNVMMREQQQIPTVIILDVPRRNQGYVSYGVLEQLKNGMIYSGKYEGGRCIFKSPHVIVFSNSYPETEEMSADRWHIVNIDDDTNKAFASLGLM